MFTMLDKEKVFRDPLYGYIRVNHKLISDLIDSKEVQRLRRIRQLSGVLMVFHMAEHSRFAHSLGTYELARRIIDEVSDIKNTFSERDTILFLATALLHDCGHGPYSHCFEHVYGIDHEKMSSNIILGNSQIHEILDEADNSLAKDIAGIIEHEGKYPIIESLISSQLDVDRMDYLCRDSYFTGAFYGNIDVEKIMRSMRIINGKLVYRVSACNTIEDYIIGRYHMYWSVYYHPVARSYEIMLEKIYLRIKDLIQEGYSFNYDVSLLEKAVKGKLSIEDYLLLDDVYINGLIHQLQNTKDQILSELAQSFMNRKLFTYMDYEHNGDLVDKITKEASKDPIYFKYYFKKDLVKQVGYQYQLYQPLANEINILLPSGEIKPITDYSQIIKGLANESKMMDSKIFFKEITNGK